MVWATWYIWINIQILLKNINWLGMNCLIVLVMVLHIFSNYSETSLEIQHLSCFSMIFYKKLIQQQFFWYYFQILYNET